ncbi:MAG: serine hydrolase [Planctomycetales bacterium]|nr:serine hydrolase [Planctomycetales bacterium]
MYRAAVVSLLIVLLGWATVCFAKDLPQRIAEKVDQRIGSWMDEKGIPGISLSIAISNQLVLEKGYGQADVENAIAVTPRTKFRTASIAKSMTAVLVLSLADQGTLDLDLPVSRYIPDFPQKRWPITPRQLLGHLSGVRHYASSAESSSTEHFFSLEQALNAFKNDPLRHEPGSKYLYSTFGYNLLGTVAEKAAGENYLKLLETKVLAPAGMKDTVADDVFQVIGQRSRGYIRPSDQQISQLGAAAHMTAGELYNATLHDTSMKIPGGGLLSTPSDLIRFAIALNQGRLLSDATKRAMWIERRTSSGEATGYGLGWRIAKRDGELLVWHTGGQAGTSTVLMVLPQTGISMAIMCNLQNVSLVALANTLLDDINAPTPIDYTAAIGKLNAAAEREVQQKQLPALSIAIVDNEEMIWASGYGTRDVEQKQPVNEDTVYRVGSVSKLFTDIAIMQLVEQGKLDLDAPIQTYLPQFQPENSFGVEITLRQLMTHRSGLVRESPVGNYFDPTEPSLAATVDSLNHTALVYKPESKTKYSNAAIAVVGAVLEQQIANSHADQVRQSILDPLKMQSSGFQLSPDMEENLAVGWMRTYDGRRFSAPTFQLGTGPAGNMFSSVTDLSKFLSCLFCQGQYPGGAILTPATLQSMFQPSPEAGGSGSQFGIGFHIQQLDGITKIGHGGAIYGYSTQLEALPTRKLGVAAVAALDGSNGVVQRLADYALRLMIATQDGKPLPEYATTEPIPSDRAQEMVGLYRNDQLNQFARISEMSDSVFLQRGSYRFSLRSLSENGEVVVDDPVGFGVKVSLESSDKLMVDGVPFERVSSTPPAPPPKRWEGLIGEYGWDHNTLYILEDAGVLYALIEWFYYYPLTEVDRDTFKFPDYGLYHGEGLAFSRDAADHATKVLVAEVEFLRREVGTKNGETFKIVPVKPIDELRQSALTALPPSEAGSFRNSDLVEVTVLDPTIKLDIRYATENNFTGSVFYQQPKAFLQRPAAEAVVRANQRLKPLGLGLLIHDAYRPWHVTKMFWDATPNELKDFVANPQNGSRHNRGCAVDITLYDLQNGQAVPMVAGYDEFSPRSFPMYPGGTARQRWFRELLRQTMEAEGFSIYEFEWWHFDYRDWRQYRIGNARFEDIHLGQQD